jgi:hypothetical protein
MVHVHVGENVGDRQRMLDIGLAAFARLPFVGIGTETIGAADFSNLISVEVGACAPA